MIVFAFLFAPIAVIIVNSFNTGRLLAQFTQFGFDSFGALFTKEVIRDAVVVSVQTGIIAAIVASASARSPASRWRATPADGCGGSSCCCCSSR